MHCTEAQNRITDYIREELPEGIRAQITEHFALCADCRRELESLKRLWSEMDLFATAEPEIVSLRSKFHSMLESFQQTTMFSVRSLWRRWSALRLALVMALLAAVVFATQQNGVLTVVISRLVPRQLTTVSTTQNGTVTGRLLFPDGQAAMNIRVGVMAAPESSPDQATNSTTLVRISQTDNDGRYRLENIPPGRYYITAGQVEFPTFYPGTTGVNDAKAIAITSGAVIDGIDFTLSRTFTVKVSGHVTRAPNQLAGTNQTISLYGVGFGQPLTSVIAIDGSFEFPAVRPGNYQIAVAPTNGIILQQVFVGDKDVTIDVVIPLAVNVTGVAAVDGGGILPRVTTEFTSVVTGIAAYHSQAGSSEDGKFMLALPAGEYRVTVGSLPPGYSLKAMKSASIDLMKDTLKIGSGDSPQIVVILGVSSPPPWVKVRGRVTGLSVEGIAASGVSLVNGSIVQAAPQATLANDGSFEFPMVLPGTYRLNLLPPSTERFAIPPVSVNVPAGRGDVSDLVIALPSMKRVSGRIIWEGDGPRPPIGFVLGNSSTQAQLPRADANGRFSILAPEGEQPISLRAIPPGYILKSFSYGATDLVTNPLKVSTTDTAELQVVLTPANASSWVRVRGRVLGIPSSPLAPSLTRVTLNSSAFNSTVVARDGTFELPDVLPGSYIISASYRSELTASTSIVVGNTDVTGIEIKLPRQVTVSGQAKLEGNGPIPLVGLQLNGASGSSVVSVQPRPDGSFTIDLPEGEFSASFTTRSLPPGFTVSAMSYGDADLLTQPLRVSGDSPSDLKITFRTAGTVTAVKVSGHVIDGTAGSTVGLNPSSGAPSSLTTVGSDGSFEFQSVLPGRYVLRTIKNRPPGPAGQTISVPISKNLVVGTNDINDIELVFPREKNVTVRNVMDGGQASPRLSLQLESPEILALAIIPANSASISLPWPIGVWRLSFLNLPAGYSVKSLTYGTANLLKDPLTITDSDTAEIQITLAVDSVSLHKISGHVTGDRGTVKEVRIAGPVAVVAPIAADGTFESPGVPPGNYMAGFILFRSSPTKLIDVTNVSVPVVVRNADVTGFEITIPPPTQ